VRYAYRPFDRHWVVPDARLGDFPRPSLWRVAGSYQVFVSTMLTNVLGPGPAVVATRHVPDLDHFRGSFGARGVIPLWLDAEGTRPNVSEGWLERLAERYGLRVGAPELLAYCYALLSAPAYTCRFADELRSPGPRVPLAADRATFERVTGLGQRLLGLHTYQEVVRGQAHVARPIGESYPTAFVFDAASASVWLGDGCIAPVSPEVWDYSVSGYRVLSGWLRRRLKRSGRSPLDTIGPLRWEASLTAELLELVWLVEATIALGPVLDALLEAVVSSQPASRACNETETQDGCRHSSLRRVTRP
jgi:hypothetical protein